MAGARGTVCFAPAVVTWRGRDLLAYTAGAEAGRSYGTRVHAGGGTESWYLGGRNRIRLTELGTGRQGPETVLPAPPGSTDMTGASLAADGPVLRAWYSARRDGGPWQVWHAASRDGLTWAEPVLAVSPGAEGSSDGEHVLLPSVLRRGGQWLMWYAGRDGTRRRIHLASSRDGMTWRKHGTVLGTGPAGSPDGYAADCPAVTGLPGGDLLMLYGAGTSRSVAAAVSRDGGRTWDRLGPVLHRGPAGAPDSRYAFYPALLPLDRTRAARLLYAGEDDHGHWRILSAGQLDLAGLAAGSRPFPYPSATGAMITRIRREVPQRFLAEPADCHDTAAPAYQSPDGQIRQLRPSTVPVFTVSPPGAPPFVVKLSAGRDRAEREADGARILGRLLPVPAMTLHYRDDDPDQAAVIMEHLDGARPLTALARAGDPRFHPVLHDVAARLAAVAAATAVPAADYPGQPADGPQDQGLLARWTADIAARLAPWQDQPLYVNGRPAGHTPGQITGHALALISGPPQLLARSSGDLHLGNILTDGTGWRLADLEYSGMHDPDRVTAGLLASVLKHSALITSASARSGDGTLHVTAGFRDDRARRLAATGFLLHRAGGGITDPARVLAFMVPALRFRLCAGPAGSLPPAPALAMLALAAFMTGRDRP